MADNEILHDRDSESYVLGSMLTDAGFASDAIVKIGADSKVFFTTDHQLIYEAMVSLHSDNQPIGTLSVANKLTNTGEINRAGGDMYLYDLQARITETDNSDYYCGVIQELHIRRDYRLFLQRASQMANDRDNELVNLADFVNKCMKKLQTRTQRPELQIEGLPHIMNTEYPEREQIIPGLLPKGLIIMAGQAKIGKSYAMLNLALAAADGGVAWSAISLQERTNTLYIAYESDPNEIKERTNIIMNNYPIPDNLYFMNMDLDNLDFKLDATGLQMMADCVKKHDIGLVIVDTWQRARPDDNGHKGNAYERDSDLLVPVQSMTKALDITTILVHHTRKGVDTDNPFNEISGSTGFQAVSDAMMVMKKTQDYNHLWVRGRRMADVQYGVKIDVQQPGVVSMFEIDDSEIPRQPKRSPEVERIYTLLSEQGVMTVGDIASELGKSESAVRQALSRMKKAELVDCPERGKYQISEGVDFS